MRLIRKKPWNPGPPLYISEAITAEFDQTDDQGRSVGYDATNVGETLASLTQMLYEKGVLTKGDVLDLVGDHKYQEAKEE